MTLIDHTHVMPGWKQPRVSVRQRHSIIPRGRFDQRTDWVLTRGFTVRRVRTITTHARFVRPLSAGGQSPSVGRVAKKRCERAIWVGFRVFVSHLRYTKSTRPLTPPVQGLDCSLRRLAARGAVMRVWMPGTGLRIGRERQRRGSRKAASAAAPPTCAMMAGLRAARGVAYLSEFFCFCFLAFSRYSLEPALRCSA